MQFARWASDSSLTQNTTRAPIHIWKDPNFVWGHTILPYAYTSSNRVQKTAPKILYHTRPALSISRAILYVAVIDKEMPDDYVLQMRFGCFHFASNIYWPMPLYLSLPYADDAATKRRGPLNHEKLGNNNRRRNVNIAC